MCTSATAVGEISQVNGVNGLSRKGVSGAVIPGNGRHSSISEAKQQVKAHVCSLLGSVNEVGFFVRGIVLLLTKVIAGGAGRHDGHLWILAVFQHVEREHVPFLAIHSFLALEESLLGIEEIDIVRLPDPGNQVAFGGDIVCPPFAGVAFLRIDVGGVICDVELDFGVQRPEL